MYWTALFALQKTAASRSEGTYETPAKDEELLYAQLKKIGIKRISADTVRYEHAFGAMLIRVLFIVIRIWSIIIM